MGVGTGDDIDAGAGWLESKTGFDARQGLDFESLEVH